MDAIYPVFARANPVFYDHPRRTRRTSTERTFTAETQPGWISSDDGIWTYHQPPELVLPEQGWKVHLSCVAERAEELLHIANAYCTEHALAFKHLSTRGVLDSTNAKDASREGSGKFVTIYTVSDEVLHLALSVLGHLTADIPGPHILSDLKWREGPVYARYGGFRQMFVDAAGARVPAIRHPDGHLVPDIRAPVFAPPAWAPIPDFLADLVQTYADVRPPDGFPEITGVLHHSNAGGIYTAREDGRDVILKEARPHTGFTSDGRDAIERSRDEGTALTTLASVPDVARLLRRFEVHGHHYLVLGKAPGVPLHQAVVARHPLVSADAMPGDIDDYRAWARRLARRLRRVVAAVHAHGLTHGDLHPGNFLVDDDGEVTLMDFEMARPVAGDARTVIGAPGFVPPPQLTGINADLFALHRIEMFLYAPLTPLLDLHESTQQQLGTWISERFHLGEGDTFLRPSSAPSTAPEVSVAELSAQLLADATPEREDRLWPGDPAQFEEPRYALAHGALGPLLALHTADGPLPDELLDWAVRACHAEPPRSGLMDGLDGAAATLETLGRTEVADALLERALATPLRWDAPGLYSGPAGAALAWLRLHDRHPEVLTRARAVFDELAERAGAWESRSSDPVGTGLAGLLRGPSGEAILAMRLYDLSGDSSLLTLAANAIRTDLARCVEGPDGALLLNEGWRLMPYLGGGSSGVAVAAAELDRRSPHSDISALLEPLRRAAAPEFVLEPGLVQGRAGLMLALAAVRGDASTVPFIDRHRRMMRLYAVPRPHGVGIPGRSLLRLSCDLLTGSAGVLWAWASLRADARRTLPFIDLPPVEAPLGRALTPGGGETHGLPAFPPEPRAH
ncbi:class III lanthionine synthetase LanKC [Microbacterium sp. KSW4-17]|uniref:non-specific serine/threonine protein kinase n=1 Tax=Microbacterium galbum TaxID=3075994 RepID=A0ABU3T6C4_9MICO|nr:class III lanthionine synthetase LanKC [Microbacterium sp. KSW4-17]MDU0366884.1 class III lanthionine synthetase LanKC [Microbacterium sp. KSW4-17]